MKKEIIFSAIAVVSIAIVLVGKANNTKEEAEPEPLTMAESCAIHAVKEILNRYPVSMVEYEGYRITEEKHHENVGTIFVQGELAYTVRGEIKMSPFAKTCKIVH
mgnify:CR=1 FL=1